MHRQDTRVHIGPVHIHNSTDNVSKPPPHRPGNGLRCRSAVRPSLAAGTALPARASARPLAQSRPAARHPLAVRVRRVAAVANLQPRDCTAVGVASGECAASECSVLQSAVGLRPSARRALGPSGLGGEELHDALGSGELSRPLRVVAAAVARKGAETGVGGAAVPDVADGAANAEGAPRPLAAVEAQPAGVKRHRADTAAAPGSDAAAAVRLAVTAAAELDGAIRLAVVHRDGDRRARIELVLVSTSSETRASVQGV